MKSDDSDVLNISLKTQSILRYLSPVSGKITTMSLPSFSSLFANSNAAKVAAPDDIPARIPSSLASLSNVFAASSSDTCIISSINSVFKTSGMNPGPIPWILCGPGLPPERTGDVTGSTATALTSGLSSFKTVATPVIVPPVPTPETSISTFPSVSLQISGAVVCLWIFWVCLVFKLLWHNRIRNFCD